MRYSIYLIHLIFTEKFIDLLKFTIQFYIYNEVSPHLLRMIGKNEIKIQILF